MTRLAPGLYPLRNVFQCTDHGPNPELGFKGLRFRLQMNVSVDHVLL